MATISRRAALKRAAGLLGVSPVLLAGTARIGSATRRPETLKILVTGGHPDDPESGCGGTIARYAQAGHEVVAVYLTRGEEGIEGLGWDEAARIRTAEAEAACRLLGARPRFVGQIDGETEVTHARYDEVYAILLEEEPDALFAHWPVDTHRDHRAMSLFAYDAWLRSGKQAAFFYYEVMSGEQTQTFRPTDYIDISEAADLKRQACHAHVSQRPEEWYDLHEQMARFRGMEIGASFAEAFVRHEQSPAFALLS